MLALAQVTEGSWEHVYEWDPAWDRSDDGAWRSAWERYQDSGDWSSLPRRTQPTVVRCRALRGRARLAVQDHLARDRPLVAIWLAAAYAAAEIVDLDVGGKPAVLSHERDETGYPRVAESTLADLYAVDTRLVIDLGQAAILRLGARPLG